MLEAPTPKPSTSDCIKASCLLKRPVVVQFSGSSVFTGHARPGTILELFTSSGDTWTCVSWN